MNRGKLAAWGAAVCLLTGAASGCSVAAAPQTAAARTAVQSAESVSPAGAAVQSAESVSPTGAAVQSTESVSPTGSAVLSAESAPPAGSAVLSAESVPPAGSVSAADPQSPQSSAPMWSEMVIDHTMKLLYATQFSVDYYDNGCAMINVNAGGRFLVVPEQRETPGGLPGDVTVLRQPLQNIYMVSTSAMDLFASLNGVASITLSGTNASGWYIDEAKKALNEGNMFYAGKYNAPDYELILSKACDLAIESTMIYHAPEVKEQLEQLGIPVLVERSSYESHPLGRMEWVKLYGVLLGKEALAERCFNQQLDRLKNVMDQKATGKTAAFFYITSNGAVNVRKSGDYVAKMIQLAGGTYVPQDLADNGNALSTMNMQMEAFYAAAKDADYIIYNSTIDGELKSIDELLAKSSLMSNFKAVKEGHVWCTEKNMFQETMGLGDMILDIHKILTEEAPDPGEMTYLYQLH